MTIDTETLTTICQRLENMEYWMKSWESGKPGKQRMRQQQSNLRTIRGMLKVEAPEVEA